MAKVDLGRVPHLRSTEPMCRGRKLHHVAGYSRSPNGHIGGEALQPWGKRTYESSELASLMAVAVALPACAPCSPFLVAPADVEADVSAGGAEVLLCSRV